MALLAAKLIAAKLPIIPAADRLTAKSIAQLEACSIRTARRLMASGQLGKVRGRARARWVERANYHAYAANL